VLPPVLGDGPDTDAGRGLAGPVPGTADGRAAGSAENGLAAPPAPAVSPE